MKSCLVKLGLRSYQTILTGYYVGIGSSLMIEPVTDNTDIWRIICGPWTMHQERKIAGFMVYWHPYEECSGWELFLRQAASRIKALSVSVT